MVKVYLGMFGLLYQANVVKKVGTCKPIDNSINNSRYRSALKGLATISLRDCKRRIRYRTFANYLEIDAKGSFNNASL